MCRARYSAEARFARSFSPQSTSAGQAAASRRGESPNANPRNDKPLGEGALISAEPGIYIPGKFGVRIEDVIYLSGGGNENITRAPKELIIL